MEERQFTYMKKFPSGHTYCIMYSWGAYYIGRLCESGDRGIAYTLRRYKTLSGAEKYLVTKITHGKDESDINPVVSYGTEEYIKKGEFWR